MRFLRLFLVAAVSVLGVWFAHSLDVKSRRPAVRDNVEASFQRALPVGSARNDVEKYLESRGLKYSAAWDSGSSSWFDVVELASANCSTQRTLVSLEFDSPGESANQPPSQSDKLKRVAVTTGGGC